MSTSEVRDVGEKRAARRPVAIVAVLAGAFAVACLLVLTTRWWTLQRLDAGLVWSLTPPAPQWPVVLGVTAVLVAAFWLVASLPRYKVLVGVGVVGALLAGLLITASAGAAQALQCRWAKAAVATSVLTGLGMNCVRFHYRQDVTSTNLPTGRVVWIDETDGTRWVLDPATGVLHGIGTNAIVAWETASAPR